MAAIKAAGRTGLAARTGRTGLTGLTGLTTPARLRLMLAAVLAASVLWGAAAAWTE